MSQKCKSIIVAQVLSATEKLKNKGTGETSSIMGSEREHFDICGPLHLTAVDWGNVHHRRSVAACMVQAVYILERDRQQNRQGPDVLAPRWWEFFHFQLLNKLHDDADGSIFGAVFQYSPPAHHYADSTCRIPRFIIAFRGTVTKPDSFSRDLELDLHFVRNGLHRTSRFEIAMQAVQNMVASVGDSYIWLAGHSLGSAMAMLAGKTMAKRGIFLESFLFNPPYLSAPIERIKDKKLKQGIRIASSLVTAGLTVAMKQKNKNSFGSHFRALSAWVPCLFVNPADDLCAEYIGYFEHRQKMEEIGAGGIERLATQNSLGGLLMNAFGNDSEEPLHLLPSANLILNLTPSRDFKEAHGIHQWWRPELHLQSKLYKYS